MLTQLLTQLAAPFFRAPQQPARIRIIHRLGIVALLIGVFASPGAMAQVSDEERCKGTIDTRRTILTAQDRRGFTDISHLTSGYIARIVQASTVAGTYAPDPNREDTRMSAPTLDESGASTGTVAVGQVVGIVLDENAPAITIPTGTVFCRDTVNRAVANEPRYDRDYSDDRTVEIIHAGGWTTKLRAPSSLSIAIYSRVVGWQWQRRHPNDPNGWENIVRDNTEDDPNTPEIDERGNAVGIHAGAGEDNINKEHGITDAPHFHVSGTFDITNNEMGYVLRAVGYITQTIPLVDDTTDQNPLTGDDRIVNIDATDDNKFIKVRMFAFVSPQFRVAGEPPSLVTDSSATAVQQAVVNDIANSVLKVQVGALESRFQTASIASPDSARGGGQSGSAEFSATLGGQKFDTRGNAGEQATRFVSNLLSRACGGMHAGENARRACDFSTIAYDDLLAGGRFNWDFPGAFTIWGQGGVGGFSGDPKFNADGEAVSGLSYDGDFSSKMIGADYRLSPDKLVGVLLSSTDSDVTYGIPGAATDIEVELSGVSPYMQWTRGNGARIWSTLGLNSGDMTITDKSGGGADPVKTDIETQTLAVGVRNKSRTHGRVATTWKFEGAVTQVDADPVAQYERVSSDSWQTRAALDISVNSQGCCSTLSQHMEISMRADGGDNQKVLSKSSLGIGMDLGAGVEYRAHNGLALGARLRTLLLHSTDSLNEWGLNFNIGYSTDRARGLQFSLQPEWGDTASTDVWNNDALIIGDSVPEETDADWTPDSVTLRVGYGADAGGINALVTPYGEFSRRGESRKNKVGMRFQLPARSLEQLRLNMFVAQTGNRDEPKNSVRLQGRVDF